jgi:hypothetical protein
MQSTPAICIIHITKLKNIFKKFIPNLQPTQYVPVQYMQPKLKNLNLEKQSFI